MQPNYVTSADEGLAAFAGEYSRLGYFKLTADGSSCAFLDFAMPGNRGDLAVGGILPDGMIATFASHEAAVSGQVSLQIQPLHETANCNSSRTVPGAPLFRAS